MEFTEVRTERVAVCVQCWRLLDRCLSDPCYLKVIDGTARPVFPALPPPSSDNDA